MKKIILISLLFTVFVSIKTYEQTTWIMDKAHAKLGFTATHMMVSDVEGWFKSFDATITSKNEDFTDAVVDMTADVNSINTDNEKRDTHLKSADFFDAAIFSKMTFKSTSFKKAGDKKYLVKGNLTMHGVTKPVELDVTLRQGTNPYTKAPVVGFKISGTLKRSDWGIGPKFGSTMISDEITLIANAEFNQPAQK